MIIFFKLIYDDENWFDIHMVLVYTIICANTNAVKYTFIYYSNTIRWKNIVPLANTETDF